MLDDGFGFDLLLNLCFCFRFGLYLFVNFGFSSRLGLGFRRSFGGSFSLRLCGISSFVGLFSHAVYGGSSGIAGRLNRIGGLIQDRTGFRFGLGFNFSLRFGFHFRRSFRISAQPGDDAQLFGVLYRLIVKCAGKLCRFAHGAAFGQILLLSESAMREGQCKAQTQRSRRSQ